eukprot:symbB.v1.2.000258.t2/scaffold20.1/size571870/3
MVLGLCLLMCICDSLCYLPHPGRLNEKAVAVGDHTTMEDLTLNFSSDLQPGLPSWKVRRGYHKELEDLDERLSTMRTKAACDIASVAVQARAAARLKARLQGSAALHVALEVRDFLVYGWNPFTLQKMMSLKRAKLEAKGASNESISDESVCSSITGSSTRSNEAWNVAAEEAEEAGAGYIQETVILYLFISPALALVAYLLEVFQRNRSSMEWSKYGRMVRHIIQKEAKE